MTGDYGGSLAWQAHQARHRGGHPAHGCPWCPPAAAGHRAPHLDDVLTEGIRRVAAGLLAAPLLPAGLADLIPDDPPPVTLTELTELAARAAAVPVLEFRVSQEVADALDGAHPAGPVPAMLPALFTAEVRVDPDMVPGQWLLLADGNLTVMGWLR